jgi:hypothetical protein
MRAIRTIQYVSGNSLTIQLPEDFHATRVEVIILSIEEERSSQELPSGIEPRYAAFAQPKPLLTEADRELLAQRPNPLAETVRAYVDPFEPAVPPEDWAENP